MYLRHGDVEQKRSTFRLRTPSLPLRLIAAAAVLVFAVSFVPYRVMIVTLAFTRVDDRVTPSDAGVLHASFELLEAVCSVGSCLDPPLYMVASGSRGSCWPGNETNAGGCAAEPAGGSGIRTTTLPPSGTLKNLLIPQTQTQSLESRGPVCSIPIHHTWTAPQHHRRSFAQRQYKYRRSQGEPPTLWLKCLNISLPIQLQARKGIS
ncbi:hypothetical protein EYF80_013809 [Liparis tanakae]|uniref:Uncharacterized protein n=1 Tax=Liparis tanakae TaxID=230148 RepID=A0A4Z2IDL8_9TELE|nr:hypothetical protein EYF80_013809 [Liparis tanakae]